MAAKSWISPPKLEDDSKYKDWKKELKIWQALTELKSEETRSSSFYDIARQSKRSCFRIRGQRD